VAETVGKGSEVLGAKVLKLLQRRTL